MLDPHCTDEEYLRVTVRSRKKNGGVLTSSLQLSLWSLRQELDSPRQADRRLGQSNAQKRLFDRPGLSTFWRNDNSWRGDATHSGNHLLAGDLIAKLLYC